MVCAFFAGAMSSVFASSAFSMFPRFGMADVTAILPLFIRIRDLGLLDTYWGVVLPQVAFGLGMSILLFRRFFQNVPAELFDAAFVDGWFSAGMPDLNQRRR